MTMMNMVDYQISWPDDFHSPNIDNIKYTSRSPWLHKSAQKQLKISIQHPRCCIRRFDIANNNSPRVNIVFRDSFTNNIIVWNQQYEMFDTANPSALVKKIIKENMNVRKVLFQTSYTKMSNQIEITLKSPDSRQMGLTYFIVYSEERKEVVQKPKPNPKTTEELKVHKKEPQSVVIIESDDDQLQEVLKLSKLEYEKKNPNTKIVEEELPKKPASEDTPQFLEQSTQKLAQKANDRLVKIIDDVTDEWLDWQLQASDKRFISPTNSIIKYRRPKPFDHQAFCVFMSKRKEQRLLIESALRMGLEYVPEPISECYIFCENKQVLKDKLKEVRDVKILRKSYVFDCLEKWKVLDFKDYIIL